MRPSLPGPARLLIDSMPRDATETERRAMLACEELARVERRLPTVKRLMDTLGIQSPEVVGRALKRWREGFIERDARGLALPFLRGHRLEEGEGLIGGLGLFVRLVTRRTGRREIRLDRRAMGVQCGPGPLDFEARFGLGQPHQFLQGLHERDRQAEVGILGERRSGGSTPRSRRLAMERTRFPDEKLYLDTPRPWRRSGSAIRRS